MTRKFVRETMVVYGEKKIEWPSPMRTSDDVARFAMDAIGNRVNEVFLVIAVNSRHRPLAWSVIATGTPTFCIVSPADVLRYVLKSGAIGFFIAHNHPSGDPEPSASDIDLTKGIADGAKVVGLKLIDHVVIGDEMHWSFRDHGFLNDSEVRT